MKTVSVIGSGFSGLAAACYAAKSGHKVTIFEKNNEIGGRARVFHENGYTFDMGPSWYWMPDVFEKFFNDFNKKPSDYYKLDLLDPGFRIIFNNHEELNVPASIDKLYDVFEEIEAGSGEKLKKFLSEAEFKYKVGMEELVYRPGLSWFEFATWDVLKGISKTHIFTSVQSYVRSYFKNKKLIALMEFPVLFLGAMPDQIPALYTLMNFSALNDGTWYPQGGMFQIVNAMSSLARELGVEIETNASVKKINEEGGKVVGIETSKGYYKSDAVIASADYAHVDQKLLPKNKQNYSSEYWKKKTFAPSCLLFYIGVKKEIGKLIHHNLFFDTDFDVHANEIYKTPKWPTDPLFYVCCPSKTDKTVAPIGHENLFILIPIATGLEDNEELREKYFNIVISRLEKYVGEDITPFMDYKKSYCIHNFIKDYNSYGGNAYGLANTLLQTAVLKPKMINKKIKNLIYTGQLTVPGPGVPPSLISGKIAAQLLNN